MMHSCPVGTPLPSRAGAFLLAALLISQFSNTQATPLSAEIDISLDVTVTTSKKPADVIKVCSDIAKTAGVDVLYPDSPEYTEDLHRYATNAGQSPACVVEPDTPEKVGSILRIIGKNRTPFAVQSGGHAVNPGFSSTSGVHISLSRFKDIDISQDNLTVDIGAGLNWMEVYKKFDGTGRNVVGGRYSSVGVGGLLTYGGGYSYLSNEFGLAVDQMQEYTLVLANGTVKHVSAKSDSVLFNALKGSGNNFGVVTSFKLKTVPAPAQVWGGNVIWTEDAFQAVSAVVANFSNFNTDPKATIMPAYLSILNGTVLQNLISMIVIYDAPTPPAGTFDALFAIPPAIKDAEFGSRNFSSVLTSQPPFEIPNLRTSFQSLPVRSYSPRLVQAFADQVKEMAAGALAHAGLLLQTVPEPFAPSAFQHSSGKEAYLHDIEHGCLPSNLGVSWLSPAEDAYWKEVLDKAAANITAVAESEGQDLASCPLYPNYATPDTSLEKMYLKNLPALKMLRAQLDKDNVMTLAGGFKLL